MSYKDPEKQRAYNKAYLRKYRERNRERMNAYNREWRKNSKNNNPEYLKKNNEYAKKYRKLHPEIIKECSRKQGIKTRQNVRERLHEIRLEMGGCCSRCGYKEFVDILNFHHINIEEKEIEVTRLVREKAMREEAKKCILLCPNCHALFHLNK